MLRPFALTMLLATATSVLAANQPGDMRRNGVEATIPPLVLPPLVLQPPVLQPVVMAADEIDDQAQVVELATTPPATPPSWSVAVAVDARTRCALGPSVDCLANDTRLRAAGIVLDPDEPAPAEATLPVTPAPAPRTEPTPRPVLPEPVALPRPRTAALRALTPEPAREPAPVPAPPPAAPRQREPDGFERSGPVAPMQWRIAPGAWLDLRPRTELNLARGQAASVPSEPVDGGPPVPGAARLRLGISVPLEALRTHASKPLGATLPPPGVAQTP
jgi:hypothetical protein